MYIIVDSFLILFSSLVEVVLEIIVVLDDFLVAHRFDDDFLLDDEVDDEVLEVGNVLYFIYGNYGAL